MAWMGMATAVDKMPGMASEPEIDAFGTTSGTAADEMFVDLMVAHHRGGIEMAEVGAERADNAEVRGLATAIAASQTQEIGELQRLVR